MNIPPLIIQALEFLSKVNFEIFGVGAIVFVILVLWLITVIKEKNEYKNNLGEANRKLYEFAQKQIEGDKEMNRLIGSISELLSNITNDVRQNANTNSDNNTIHHTSVVNMINDVKNLLLQIIAKL